MAIRAVAFFFHRGTVYLDKRHGAVQQEEMKRNEIKRDKVLVSRPEGLPRGERHTAQSGGNRQLHVELEFLSERADQVFFITSVCSRSFALALLGICIHKPFL